MGFCAGAGCETARAFPVVRPFSTPSGTVPTEPAAKLFFLPNQLPLFRLERLGAWLLIVAGEPGLSDDKLSDDESVRRPRNFRTDDGRFCEGLVGERVLLATSLTRLWCNESSVPDSSDALPFAPLGKTAD